MPHHVEEMYAFIAVDEDGDEGIVSFFDPVNRVQMPMIGTDQARLESLREMAKTIVKDLGKPIQLIRMHLRQDVEWIT